MQETKRRRRRGRNSPRNPFEWILFGFLRDPLIDAAEAYFTGTAVFAGGNILLQRVQH